MQYLYNYTNVLDSCKTDYDVVYWNRLGIEEDARFKGYAIAYNLKVDSSQPFNKKIIAFFKYIGFVRKLINRKAYDKLIILTTQAAVPLTDVLLSRYRGKYIYDYRDITKERKSRIYRNIVNKIIDNSFCTMMSSPGFIKAAGIKSDRKITIVHNTQVNTEYYLSSHNDRGNNHPIRIRYWGIVRQIDFNQRFCDIFGNDDRFHLHFDGIGKLNELKAYCYRKRYNNITFCGRYKLEDISAFVNNTDILDCVYENDDEQGPAMPVKAYDAIRYRLPVLVNSGSQASNFFKGTHGACIIDIKDNDLPNKVYKWYQTLDYNKVNSDYLNLEKTINKDELQFEKTLRSFI